MDESLSLIDKIEDADVESSLGKLRCLSLHGIQVWPLIRVRLIDKPAASTHLLRRVSLSQAIDFVRGGLQLAKALLCQKFSNTMKVRNTCVFFSHPECLARLDDQWYDRFCDPIAAVAERLGFKSEVMEYSPQMRWTRPTARARLDINCVLILAKMISIFLVYLCRYKSKSKILELEKLLRESGAGAWVSVQEVESLAAYVSCAQSLLALVLRPWRIRLGFVCTYYSSSSMAFILACRRLDISVYDIQHGVQGKGHVAYRAWRPIDGRLPNVLPHGFWCWDNASAVHLQRWCRLHGGPDVVVGGNVWNEFVLNSVIYVEDYACVKPDSITVLVTLQPLQEPLPKLLLDAMANTSSDVLWLVRLHPAMANAYADSLISKLKSIGCRNFRVVSDRDEPLPRQLVRTNLHVTVYSSVVIEAAALGVPSVVIDRRAVELYQDELNNGKVLLVRSAQELIACIASAKRVEPARRLTQLAQTAFLTILQNTPQLT